MHSQSWLWQCVRARFMRCLAACQLKLPPAPHSLPLAAWHLLLPAMCAMHAEQAQQKQQKEKKKKRKRKEAMQSNDCVSCRRGQ